MAFGQEAKAARKSQASAQGFARQQMRSKHQWEVLDLKAAGLNPVLSAVHAAPMSSVGPAPFAGDYGIGDTASAVSSLANTAKTAKRITPEVDLLKKQAAATEAAGVAAGSASFNSLAQAGKADQEREIMLENQGNTLDMRTAEVASAQAIAGQNLIRQKMMANQLPQSDADRRFYDSKFGTGSKWWRETLNNVFGGFLGGTARDIMRRGK